MGQRIFVHHNGALGDLLLSLPAIGALRKQDDIIHLAGRIDIVEFLEKIGNIHEGSDSESAFFLPLFMNHDQGAVKAFLSTFDRIFVFSAERSSVLAGNILTLAPYAQVVLTIPSDGSRMHVADFRLHQIDPCGPARRAIDLPLPGLVVPTSYRSAAREMLAGEGYDFGVPLVAVHPGSGGRRKCWPLENYFALIETIRAKLHPFFLIFSGPAEDATVRGKIEAFVWGKREVIHVHDRDLAGVAALLSLSTMYVGNDSGVTHLAAEVNGNVVVLFGPTDHELWRPRGEKVRVVSSASSDRSLSSITVEAVVNEVDLTPFCYD